MENKTLTAVEWLMQELDGLNRTQVEWHNAIEQALALEREQIIEAATHFSVKMSYIDAPSPAELYYTTKYGKQ